MNETQIVESCRELGCCDACCLRFIGLKNPDVYEDIHRSILKYMKSNDVKKDTEENNQENILIKNEISSEANSVKNRDEETSTAPPAKRIKLSNVCVSCLGILQEETWEESITMVKEVLSKKCYECETFACALSSPIAAILRERAITLNLEKKILGYDHKKVMPLKEAWKWSFGRRLAARTGKRLDSGAVSPLLVTLSMEYPDDARELDVLRLLAPEQYAARARQRRRYELQHTRRAAELALAGATLGALAHVPGWAAGPPRAAAPARPASAQATHAPAYLGGRYVKLSRALPQTPWLVAGRRMMHSSVQEIICAPLAAAYGLSAEEAEGRLKFMSAGREDVDVRCLGTGRPFALEVSDPRRLPGAEELRRACDVIAECGKVRVRDLVPVSREELTQLKQGEETKCKTYEALCIKLEHTAHDLATVGAEAAVRVTARDVAAVRGAAPVTLAQRTPLRVLHRRALHTRARTLLALHARAAGGALLAVRVRAQAGTYVKEWAHGELRRTAPALRDVLGARADILALDVVDVELAWPPARVPDPARASALPEQ